MVLFYQLDPFPIKAPQHSKKERGNPPLCIAEGVQNQCGEDHREFFLSYSRSKCRGLIPHLATTTNLCLLGEVDEEWGKEETYPRASPLTLTRVTKGLKNIGNEKEIEVEEERGKEGYNEPAQWESPPQGQQEFQGNQSPN